MYNNNREKKTEIDYLRDRVKRLEDRLKEAEEKIKHIYNKHNMYEDRCVG